VFPIVVAGCVEIEAWQRGLPEMLRIAVLPAIAQSFWVTALMLNVPNARGGPTKANRRRRFGVPFVAEEGW
jgi:hypothetical protein